MISRTVVNATTTPGILGSDPSYTYHLGQGPGAMKASAPVLVVARIALSPGDADAALEHARAAGTALIEARREDLHLDIVLPMAQVFAAMGRPKGSRHETGSSSRSRWSRSARVLGLDGEQLVFEANVRVHEGGLLRGIEGGLDTNWRSLDARAPGSCVVGANPRSPYQRSGVRLD
jgi:hypothetical protein